MAEIEKTEILVSVQWLKDHLLDAGIRILDARTPREYMYGHIPNAVLVGYEHIAKDEPNAPYLEVIPKEDAEKAFGDLGIGNNTTVIVYGDRGGSYAARVLWTLEYYGAKAKLLEAGFQRWARDGYPVTRDVPQVKAREFKAEVNSDIRAETDYIAKKLGDPSLVVLDSRSPDEYNGLIVQTARKSRIPGSVNVPWDLCVGANGMLFGSPDALRKVFEERGITKDKEVATYCMVGERAAHSYLALRLLGYPKAKLYEKSFSEWGNSPNLPVE
ncbi:MAG: sulfurtransferase [Thaumarchaeota archaeon]|nr:sulfurtransferase [Nitrososphaerota archaeon]